MKAILRNRHLSANGHGVLYRTATSTFSSATTTIIGHDENQLNDDEFDLCVLGCGSGGFSGAIRGWDYGKKVAVINPLSNLGGATLHNGALSSKVMWQLSRQSRHLRSMNSSLSSDSVVDSFESMRNRVYESTDIKVSHYLRTLNGLHVQDARDAVRYSSDEDGGGGNIHLFDGTAQFVDRHCVQIFNSNHQKTHTLKSRYFLIATGSRPRTQIARNELQIECDGEYILSSDDMLSLSEWPESILIYGAGVIGCEFATIFSNYGRTKNIILFNEGRDRLLPREDREVSQFLMDTLQYKSKVTVANNVSMMSMDVDRQLQKVKCVFHNGGDGDADGNDDGANGGNMSTVYVDKVLVAAGRVPNIDTLNLNAIRNSSSNDDVSVHVDNHLRLTDANCSHIYMCGDALGKWGLVSIAEMESRHCVEFMFASKNPITRLQYDDISSVMFVRPEISCVGMNEIECQKRGISYKCGLLRLGLVNRSVIDWNVRNAGPIEPKRAGFIKMIVTDDDDKQLLGLRCIGVGSSAALQTAAMLISKKQSIREIEKICHAHPAINESVQECARMLLGRSCYKPHIWPRSYVKHWSPGKGDVFAEEIIPTRFRQTVPGYI